MESNYQDLGKLISSNSQVFPNAGKPQGPLSFCDPYATEVPRNSKFTSPKSQQVATESPAGPQVFADPFSPVANDVDRPSIPERLRVTHPKPAEFLGVCAPYNKADGNEVVPSVFHGTIGPQKTPEGSGNAAHVNPPLDQEPLEEREDVPLLTELEIFPERIYARLKSALLFQKVTQELLVDVDMCGPLFIALCLGCCLLLAGKIHFGYIYGLGVFGCLGLCCLLNLMSQAQGIGLYSTINILGYGLLPVVILASISVLFNLRTLAGCVLSFLAVLWCTVTASRFFVTALDMREQRFLVAYPISLLYGCFVLITIF